MEKLMFKVGRIGTLVHALCFGALAPAGTVAAATMVAGCADEAAPETHVARLADPIKRTAAVERLIQMYNDKMTTDKQDRNGEAVKPLLDKIVQPLADLAEKGDLDQKTQGTLLSMLADTRDKRALKALVKALDAYKSDDKRPDEIDANINDVVRNIGELPPADAMQASDALLKLFTDLHASWPKAQNKTFYRTIRDTMLKLNDPKWEATLIKLVDTPVKTLSNKELRAITDQMYWQTVAAEILGNVKSTKAVPALIKVVLTPFKGPVGVTAISALIKIGKPAIDAGVKLLNGEDAELKKYAYDEFLRAIEDKGEKVDDKKKKDADKAYLDNAVIIVTSIGSSECIAPLLAAIDKGDETSDAIIGSKLFMLPADQAVTDKFKEIWTKTKINASSPGGGNAKVGLTDVASSFLDPALAVSIAKASLELKGDGAEDTTPSEVQDMALQTVMKIGGPAESDLIDKLAAQPIDEGGKKSTVGKAYEKELKIVRTLIKECGDKGDCWFKKLESPDAQKDSGFVGIKAAYMAAILGGTGARAKLIALRSTLSHPAVIFTVESMIDRLSPKGDKEGAEKLQAIVDKALASKDEERQRSVTNLKTVVNRMRARLQS